MSQQLLEDVTRAYLGAKIQTVHLNNNHLHGLSYNHHRDVERKLGLAPDQVVAQQPPSQQHQTDQSSGSNPGDTNERMGISPFPGSVRSSVSNSSATTAEPKKRSSWPLIGATAGALLLGTAGGAIGAKMMGGTPAPNVQQVDAPLPPVSVYEQRTGSVELEVR